MYLSTLGINAPIAGAPGAVNMLPPRNMAAQSPTGASVYVPPPTTTPAGPIMQPPTAAAINTMPAPTGSISAPSGAPADAKPSIPTSLQTVKDPAQIAGTTMQGSPGNPGLTVPTSPPPTATPGATATAGSAANLAIGAPNAAQIGAQGAPAAAGAPISTTSGTGAGAITKTALTGAETPYTVDPTMSSGLSDLLAKAQAAVGRGLDQPTVWDDTLAKSITDAQKRGINENYTAAGDSLDAELAGRGLNWSSIAGNRVVDLKTRQAQELSGVDTSIARERANALAAGRSSALSSAQQLINAQSGIETGQQNAARGERNYVTGLQTQAHDQALQDALAAHGMTMADQQSWMNAINSGLGYGTGTAGTAALGQAGNLNAVAAGQQSATAAQDNQQLATLAQLAMQFFGGK